MHKIFLEAHKFISDKVATLQLQTMSDLKESVITPIEEPAERVETEKPTKDLPVARNVKSQSKFEIKLSKQKMIDEELNKLVSIKDYSARFIREYELLSNKAELCDSNDIDSLLSIMIKMNRLQIIMQNQLILCAAKRDLNSVMILQKYVNYIPTYIYFECVCKGFTEVMIYLIERYKFNINVYNIMYLSDKGSMEYLSATLLLTAIEKNNGISLGGCWSMVQTQT